MNRMNRIIPSTISMRHHSSKKIQKKCKKFGHIKNNVIPLHRVKLVKESLFDQLNLVILRRGEQHKNCNFTK